MRVTKSNGCYTCVCSYQDREIPKAAGFRWNDPVPKAWGTRSASVAAALAQHADDTCKDELLNLHVAHQSAVAASWAGDSEFNVPVPEGLTMMPFQRAGVAYMISKLAPNGSGGVLLADDMGLGKTIQAIGCINLLNPSTVLIICPASLKLNWRDELKKWLTHHYDIQVVMPRSHLVIEPQHIYIINYDIIDRFNQIDAHRFDMAVIDEAHMIKNPDTLRGQCILGRKEGKKKNGAVLPAKNGVTARAKIALTGTPIPNRPIEIQAILKWLQPDIFGNRMRFAMRYCGAVRGRFGWEMDGVSHAEELNTLLRSSCMCRRLKKDVLTELPPKIRQVIELPCDGLEDVLEGEWAAYHAKENVLNNLQVAIQLAKASQSDNEYQMAVENLKAGLSAAFNDMALMRLKVARAKLPFLLNHLNDITSPDHQIICFANHKEIVREIIDNNKEHNSVGIHGDTSLAKRHEHAKMFQAGASRLIVGTFQPMGTGWTLTRSSHVVFAEGDWTPSTLSQAEDRAHRIGQRDSVLVQHLVLEGSLDAVMAKRVVEKQNVINQVLNKRVDAELYEDSDEPIVDTSESYNRPATVSTSRQKIAEMATHLTPQDIRVIQLALQCIAGLDGDFARIKNDVGFNRLDADVGHDLAKRSYLSPRQGALAYKIARKYVGQMPSELVDKLKGIQV